LINYIGHMLVIGLALGYTIRFKVPNTIKGVSISNPSIEVQVLKIYFIPCLFLRKTNYEVIYISYFK
jgi:hypothetical protein